MRATFHLVQRPGQGLGLYVQWIAELLSPAVWPTNERCGLQNRSPGRHHLGGNEAYSHLISVQHISAVGKCDQETKAGLCGLQSQTQNKGQVERYLMTKWGANGLGSMQHCWVCEDSSIALLCPQNKIGAQCAQVESGWHRQGPHGPARPLHHCLDCPRSPAGYKTTICICFQMTVSMKGQLNRTAWRTAHDRQYCNQFVKPDSFNIYHFYSDPRLKEQLVTCITCSTRTFDSINIFFKSYKIINREWANQHSAWYFNLGS